MQREGGGVCALFFETAYCVLLPWQPHIDYFSPIKHQDMGQCQYGPRHTGIPVGDVHTNATSVCFFTIRRGREGEREREREREREPAHVV